ncbi:TraX family protein [Butyrivibrio sp. AC2005]|uniref:TraX family protein n=1 Tax=Butyrivibrio sp. AC2005 TaxID=1280672 RepID=UPI0012DD16AC|nr:TraX family protein [Butyrivibrio sp. AC2005]
MNTKEQNIFSSLQKFQFVNADCLKIISIVCMLIDHIGAGILLYLIRSSIYPFGMNFDQSAELYHWLRHIGRQAFPIYCFLIVEGLIHTRSVPKYLMNLGIFGVISEPFFDIAVKVKNEVFSTDIKTLYAVNKEILLTHRNVYFTLLIGLFVIWVMQYVESNLFTENPASLLGMNADNPLHVLIYTMPVVAGAALAQVIDSDYRWWGVCLIAIFFVFRRTRLLACIAGYLFFMNMGTEVWSLPAFILIAAYNGTQGSISKKFKYAFYAFYPVHLLVIYLLRCYLYVVMQ